jgi:hypothetical protein
VLDDLVAAASGSVTKRSLASKPDDRYADPDKFRDELIGCLGWIWWEMDLWRTAHSKLEVEGYRVALL